MKIGVSTDNLERFGKNRYHMLKNCGFSCVDYNLAHTNAAPYTLGEKEFTQYLSAERQLAEDAGIQIHQVHGPWRWPAEDGTPEHRAERLEKMQRSIRAAALLGSPYWVIHPIMPFGIMELGTEHAQETWDLNMDFMKELLETAKANNITICLENMPMPQFSMATPEKVLQFVNSIDDKHFKICLDTGHVAFFPSLTPGGTVRELGNNLCALHIHDNDGKRDLHHLPYTGVIDWADFGRALRETHFQGVFSFETVPPADCSLSDAEKIYSDMIEMAQKILEG